MKIYTRRGDSGETDLLGGARVAKNHLRVESYGAVDELNASLGVCRVHSDQEDVLTLVERLQRELFELGAHLASSGEGGRGAGGLGAPSAEAVAFLEDRIDAFEKELPPLRHFVLPGGTAAAASFHVARTCCRRAERCLVALAHAEKTEAAALGYLNRLSDLLFVLARVENHRSGVVELEWSGRGDAPPP